MGAKIRPGQTQIPHEPGQKLTPEEAYAAEFGERKLYEQQWLHTLETICNCKLMAEGNQGYPRHRHEPGCKSHGLFRSKR